MLAIRRCEKVDPHIDKCTGKYYFANFVDDTRVTHAVNVGSSNRYIMIWTGNDCPMDYGVAFF